MHVVLVTTSYPESSSGSEAAGGFVADFAHQLARYAKVTVVAATSGPASVRTEGSLTMLNFGRTQSFPGRLTFSEDILLGKQVPGKGLLF